jgi:hypothetical protein
MLLLKLVCHRQLGGLEACSPSRRFLIGTLVLTDSTKNMHGLHSFAMTTIWDNLWGSNIAAYGAAKGAC